MRVGSSSTCRVLLGAACGLLCAWSLCAIAGAGEVIVEDGFRIRGTPVEIVALTPGEARRHIGNTEIKPILMIDDGMRRTYVTKRRVPPENINRDAELNRYETFYLDQRLASTQQIGVVGGFQILIPFNEHGRRTIQIGTPKGPVEIVQGITEINPFHVKIGGVTHKMSFSLATTSFRHADLKPILHQVIDPSSPNDRLALARFYLQSEQVHLSLAELDSIRREFPDVADRVTEFETELLNQESQLLLRELNVRRAAGQHQLARIAANGFESPRFASALKPEIKDQVRQIISEEDDLQRRIDEARLLLGDLQARVENSEHREMCNLPRSEIVAELDAESLPRLQSFVNFLVDESLAPEQKLALAFSGWILGSENARTDFLETIRLWDARRLVLDYLRNPNPQQTPAIAAQIESTEGVDPLTLSALLRYLPPIIETPQIARGSVAGQLLELETVESGSLAPVPYTVLLPMEYTPGHEYPLIVELRPREFHREQSVRWWGGRVERPEQSQRRGYIVIAPEYLPDGIEQYDYSVEAHRRVHSTIVDALKRFSIDPDRVFLAGHSAGAEAAYDFGLAHPDLFAGVIAISGYVRYHCKYTYENDPRLPLYAVGGELDRDTLAVNAEILDMMIRRGRDAIFVEYIGRGYEDYYEEIHRLFDWMDLKRRSYKTSRIQAKVVRPSDNRLYWLEGSDFPAALFQSDPSNPGSPVTKLRFNATLIQGTGIQTLSLDAQTGRLTVWLSPENFDFSKPLKIQGRRRPPAPAIPQPSIATMLEDFNTRADRKHVAWAKLVVD